MTDKPSSPDIEQAMIGVMASLAAAISLLERTPKAKSAAPSNTMFEMMLSDYRKALEAGRAAIRARSSAAIFPTAPAADSKCPVCGAGNGGHAPLCSRRKPKSAQPAQCSAGTTTPVCCYCDAPLSCASCGREQPADDARPTEETPFCVKCGSAYDCSKPYDDLAQTVVMPENPPDMILAWLSDLRGHHTQSEHAEAGKRRYALMRAEIAALAISSTDRAENTDQKGKGQ